MSKKKKKSSIIYIYIYIYIYKYCNKKQNYKTKKIIIINIIKEHKCMK